MKKLLALFSVLALLSPYIAIAADSHSANWGTTAYGEAADAASLGFGASADFTIEAWVYPTALPASNTRWNTHPFISKWQAGFNREYYVGLSKDAGGTLYLDVVTSDDGSSSGGHMALTGKAMNSYSANTWIYVAVSYTDSTGTFTYFQGAEGTCPTSLGTTADGFGAIDGTSRIQVARGDNVTNNTFPGYFGELRLWRAAKTSSDLGAAWTPSSVTSGTSLMEVWQFDNSMNASVNGNNLSTFNSPTFTTTKPTITASCGGGGGAAPVYDDQFIMFSLLQITKYEEIVV